ncbi:unnamed protein product [Phyllotreta striolata]|uniref:Transcription factor Adf-1 n=1 Tax=Phyllotreta striolata TaxID=444603 RepID=A0A9N9TPI9_PHYSR|nr:unnamed protein product [Phyllotreta striolata]
MSDQQLNLKLVKEIEKHEELYNYTLPAYSRRDVVEEAWQEVAFKMNMSATKCKHRWRNIRTVLMRKMKHPSNGSGARKKAYYLETAMQFCLPFIKSVSSSSGYLPPVKLPPTDDNKGDEITELYWSGSDSMTDDISRPAQSAQESPTGPSPCNSPDLSQPGPSGSEQQEKSSLRTRDSKKKLTKRISAAALADESVVDYFRAKKTKMQQTVGETMRHKIDRQEGLKMFLLSILPELEELNESQIKYFKRRVLALIDEISPPPQNLLQNSSQNQQQVSTFHSIKLSPQCNTAYISENSEDT